MRTAVGLVFLVSALGGASPAHALPYETFVDIDDAGDLEDLFEAGTISEDTYDELLDLLERGIDLDGADRGELYTLPNLTYDDVDAIIAFRELQKGHIGDPAGLVAAGALSEEKLLAISAFLVMQERGDNPLAARGWVRATTRTSYHDFDPYSPSDPFIPPLALRGRVFALRHVTAGIAMTNTRLDIGPPVYDPNRGALIAEARSNEVQVPKGYVKWETDAMTAIGGSFRAGFGQRLVFDNSRYYTPNGLYLDDQLLYKVELTTACKQSAGELVTSPCTGNNGAEYVTPDFTWREGLFGIGVGAKRFELTQGWMQAYGFASVARRSIYQYELHVRSPACEDPHDDSNPDCAAPIVYVRPDGDLLTPTTRHSFATLPNVFQDRIVGGNVAYFSDRRNSVGLTAYGADEVNLVGGIDLDRQEWSRVPYGGRFGALGANVSFGRDWLDLFGEAALSFDRMTPDPTLTPARGGGGPAGIVRMTATKKGEELEVVGRYYGTDFANPYARPISQADQFEGQRARDEMGGRARYIRSSKAFKLRSLVDVWTNPSAAREVKLDSYVRANVRTTNELWLGLWERYQDKGLSDGGHVQCYEISTETDENGEPVPCAGRQITTTLRAQYTPNKLMSATVQVDHQLLDDDTRMELQNKFRQDIAAWFVGYYRPVPGMRVRLRVRYLDEAIHDNTYLERSVAARGDWSARVRGTDSVRIRVDTKFWLDKRMSTQMRVPNPELALWLFYEAKL